MAVIKFFVRLIKKFNDEELFSVANEMAYKIILAIFPFVIFLMTILGYLNIDSSYLQIQIRQSFPNQIADMFDSFINEVVHKRSISLMSVSFIITIVNSASGIKAVMRGVNKTLGQKETRSFVKLQAISIALVFIFMLCLVSMLVLIIFSTTILNLMKVPQYYDLAFSGISFAATSIILFICVTLTYKMSSSYSIKFVQLIPGSLFTVLGWVTSSKIFNIYIDNFSKYSRFYGSIASIFILMLWLNILSLMLLVGSEINALCGRT